MSNDQATLSESTAMYLTVIYRLTQNQPTASTTDIATQLAISRPSVTEQLKRLHKQGYVRYEWREGGTLTPLGEQMVMTVLRRNRLVKAFLVEFMGYGLDEVYSEACRLQHSVSARLANGLEKMLGFPCFDPHGQPIPTECGQFIQTNQLALTSIEPGQTVIISQVPDFEPSILRYLLQRGIKPGATLTLLDFPLIKVRS